MTKALSVALALILLFSPFTALATNVQLRQEINIVDGYLFAPSGSYATSSAIVDINPAEYTSPTYYFEVVATTTAATNATISLVNATSGATIASITANGTSYALYRSSSFTAPTMQTSYQVQLGKEAVGKGIIAARIIVIDNAASITNEETQIEIGDQETNLTSVSTSTLASPKYWTYDSTKWDGSPTFYAEATFQLMAGVASSTTYATAGTFTGNLPTNAASTSVELWGGGGAGGGSTVNNDGGGGGAGGQYARSWITNLGGKSMTLVVGATKAGTTGNGTAGNDSTFNTSVVVAKGGAFGTGNNGAGGTGSSTSCVGTICFAGGSGSAGAASTRSGGGGGGAGSGGAGGSTTASTSGGTGTATGGGNGGAGLASGSNANGGTGTQAGGGGGGAYRTTTTSRSGGTGAAGEGKITDYMASSSISVQQDNGAYGSWTDVATLVANSAAGAATSTLVASAAFVPVSGDHYRLAYRVGASGEAIAIYNAKIVVDQATGSPVDEVSYTDTSNISTDHLGVENYVSAGIPFIPPSSFKIGSDSFYLFIEGSPTGNLISKIYSEQNSSGYGVDSIPNTLLATSDNLPISSVVSNSFNTFSFSGMNQITLNSGTAYITTVEYDGGDSSNNILFVFDDASTAYGTNLPASSDGTTFFAVGEFPPATLLFKVFSVATGPTKLEPQYQLANTKFFSGTSLQNYLQDFDSTEWSGTANNYLYDVDTAGSSASVISLSDNPATKTYATVSSPNNIGTTTLACIPSIATTFDSAASTNNGDIYGSRILADVAIGGGGGAGICAVPVFARGILNALMTIRSLVSIN